MSWFQIIEDLIMFFSILTVGFALGVLFAEKRFGKVVKDIYRDIHDR